MSIRLVQAPISISFSTSSLDDETTLREFHKLSDADDDPINQWLKLAKGRGETADTDPVVLNLLVELHHKLDALEALIKNEKPSRLELNLEANIESIGFEYFNLLENILTEEQIYYGRISMPVHPKRDIAIFFKAESQTLAKIIKIHERDEKDYNSYLTARERVLIREAKEQK
ncbi:MAG: hypothetical protein RBR59_04365 [Sulfurimonadaceae bacterium]|jgi:hypothetical protein|nr:hypothetical protein [Sulfurimonadaceae bacterium]